MNISTNALIGNEKFASSFRLEEVERQAHFVSTYSSFDLRFKLPHNLIISPVEFIVKDSKENSLLKSIIDKVEEWIKTNNLTWTKQTFVTGVKKNFLYYFFDREVSSNKNKNEQKYYYTLLNIFIDFIKSY